MHRTIVLALLLAVSLVGKGQTKYEQFIKAAKKGDPEAQYQIGQCYERGGRGVEKDLNLAFEWFSKAASQGLAKAQCDLGVFYARGLGVVVDNSKAVYWF